MFIKSRAFLASLMILAVLGFSAFGPMTTAYADGGTPTDASQTQNSNECSQGKSSGCSSWDADTSEEKSSKKDKDAPAWSDVPENTAVTIVNAKGEAEPLATQAAADALAESDPIWCPAAQTTPTPGLNNCTQFFPSLTALLGFLSGNATYSGAGTIFIQQGSNPGSGTINFNNYDLSNLSTANLTITGGWNMSTGVVDSTSQSAFNNVSLVIGSSTNPWAGSLSINNISLTNPSNSGLVLFSQLDINLSNVTVTNSTNGAGAELNSGRDVNINNSRFDRNKTAGAIVRAARNVAIANSSFSNPADGRRQIMGLDIVADGAVSLLNVLANENREVGAHIDAGGRVSISNSVFSGTKIIRNSEFLGYGLTVVTPDIIDLETVTANDNFLWGAFLTAGGDVNINNSIFNLNTTESPGFIDDTGLLVLSGGNVSINNSHADENRLIGATINATGDVSINNSTFNSNNGVTLDSSGAETFHGYGLQVITTCPVGDPSCFGNITLTGVSASDNTLFGAHLDAVGDVIIATSNFNNHTTGSATDPLGRGLEVIADGNVFLDTVTLDNNQTFGANILAGGDVFLDTVTATNNGTDGVEVEASCTTVFLINGTYSDNGQYGLSILNAQLNQSGTPVFANNAAGNIFEDPGTCIFTPPTTPTTPTTPPSAPTDNSTGKGTSWVSQNTYTSSGKSAQNSGNSAWTAAVVTLNSYLANGKSIYASAHLGVFTGKYAYVYTSQGMHIVAFTPSSLDAFAMVGPH